MTEQAINLAIETSSRHGSVAVGRDDALLESAALPVSRRPAEQLLAMVDRLAVRHDFQPAQIKQVFVSIGPGSFTGLRIGVTVAKMLARAVGSAVVAVGTLDVVAANGPADERDLAVCLNAKGGRCFTGFYRRQAEDWRRLSEPALLRPDEIVRRGPGSFAILGDCLPAYDWPGHVRLLAETLAVPRAEVVWRLGRSAARAGAFADPVGLTPWYVRLPEAEEKWRQRMNAAPNGGV